MLQWGIAYMAYSTLNFLYRNEWTDVCPEFNNRDICGKIRQYNCHELTVSFHLLLVVKYLVKYFCNQFFLW